MLGIGKHSSRHGIKPHEFGRALIWAWSIPLSLGRSGPTGSAEFSVLFSLPSLVLDPSCKALPI